MYSVEGYKFFGLLENFYKQCQAESLHKTLEQAFKTCSQVLIYDSALHVKYELLDASEIPYVIHMEAMQCQSRHGRETRLERAIYALVLLSMFSSMVEREADHGQSCVRIVTKPMVVVWASATGKSTPSKASNGLSRRINVT
jgi:hypothetical protein